MSKPQFDRRAYPEGMLLGQWRAPDGWPLRTMEWRQEGQKARGSILFQTGRGDMIEKYLESCAHWFAAGWNVSAFDWRGQGGSGRFLPDPHVGHVEDFGQWTADLKVYFEQWKASHPGPHILMGHSMGGHLVLRTLIEYQLDVDAAVLLSPMLGFEAGPLPVSWAAQVIKLYAKRAPTRLAWKANERPSLPGASRQRFLTHDLTRYGDELWWQKEKPDLVLGPPSLNWLSQAHQSCLWMEETGRLEAIDTPLLIIGTDGDRLVSARAIRRFAVRLPRARLKMYSENVAHEVLREVDGVRDEIFRMIDDFLDETATRDDI
jgi:lysophospholipase